MPVEPIFLRPREAAALAGLSTRAIYGAINRGELRAVRLCSRLRIPREAWITRDGFRAAEQTGELPPSLKFAPRREAIFDYRYVIHDLREAWCALVAAPGQWALAAPSARRGKIRGSWFDGGGEEENAWQNVARAETPAGSVSAGSW